MNSFTPAKLMPPSCVNSWTARIRWMSRSEYRRVFPEVRFGCTSPLRSYILNVCGCTPASSAATLMM
jgi:hypothetical protein